MSMKIIVYVGSKLKIFIAIYFCLVLFNNTTVPYSVRIRNKELVPYSLFKSNKELPFSYKKQQQ